MSFLNYAIILENNVDTSVIVGGTTVDEAVAAQGGTVESNNTTDEAADGEASTTVPPANAAPPQQTGLFGNSWIMWGLIIVVYIVVLYFLSARPNKKREKEFKEMQDSLKVGDSVVTTSGFYGKIVDKGVDVVVVEFGTNKGVRVPVSKTDIAGIKEPTMVKTHKEVAEDVEK